MLIAENDRPHFILFHAPSLFLSGIFASLSHKFFLNTTFICYNMYNFFYNAA